MTEESIQILEDMLLILQIKGEDRTPREILSIIDIKWETDRLETSEVRNLILSDIL